MNRWLWLDHLVLVLSGAHLLGLWEGFGGPENWGIIPLFHISIASLLFSSLKACILHLKDGTGITLLLYGENIVDSTVWSLKEVYMPFTILIVTSMSTVSVGKHVCIGPKMKSHIGLISLAIFCNIRLILLNIFCLLFF